MLVCMTSWYLISARWHSCFFTQACAVNSIRGIAARAAVCLSYTLYFLSGEQKQIILTALIIDLYPISFGDWSYSFWIVGEEVQRLGTFFEDFVVGVEDRDSEFVWPQIGPDVFHGVQFWWVWRQFHGLNIVWYLQAFCTVRDSFCDLIEVQPHNTWVAVQSIWDFAKVQKSPQEQQHR